MNKLLNTLVMLFIPLAIYPQQISREEADSLVYTLSKSKPDTGQIDILLKLAKYHVLKPGENKNDLDSAATLINKAEILNTTIKSRRAEGYILLIKSFHLKEDGQRDKAKEIVEQAINILKNEEDKFLLGEAYFELAGYYNFGDSKELEERIRLMELAVSCFQQIGNMERLGASRQMLGDLYQINGEDFKSLQQLNLSLDAYESANHMEVQGIYCLMGFIYARQRDHRRALDYQLLALKTAESVRDTSMQLCQINNYIGEVLLALNEGEKAIDYYTTALHIAEKYKDHHAIYITATHIAFAWTKLGRPHEALHILKSISEKYEKPHNWNIDYNIARCYINSYSLLKQYDKAEPYCDQLLNMVRTLGMNDQANISIYVFVIRFYIDSGQHTLAVKYLNEHQVLAEQLSDLYHMATNHKLRFMIDTTQQNYLSAVAYLIHYNRLNDSLFNETKSKQIAELQIQFDTEKKEQEIQFNEQNIELLTKEKDLQEAKLQQANLTRNITFGGVALLLIIVGLLYNQSRIKQRSNRQLQAQHTALQAQQQELQEQQQQIHQKNQDLEQLLVEKERLLKEIHHRVKNNLQIVMSLLNSQAASLQDKAALSAIQESQNRVQAMALIHQKLYQAEGVARIPMNSYIEEVMAYLRDSYALSQQLSFKLDIERLELDVTLAVPLGLIINEAITNAFKYAFPGNRSGTVNVSLHQKSDTTYELTIVDNGVGLPAGYNPSHSRSLGMTLMHGFSAQLGGELCIDSREGVKLTLEFKDEQLNAIHSKADYVY